MEIAFSASFSKQYRKANKKIKKAFYQRLQLFKQDSHHLLLRNHSLTGSYRKYRSINVTGDWRAIYSEEGKLIVFEMLGTHSQLYK
jgi:addiction module RelE/StbE family toxin